MTIYAKNRTNILLLSAILCFLSFEVCAKDYVPTTNNMAGLLAKGDMLLSKARKRRRTVERKTAGKRRRTAELNTAGDTFRYLTGGLLGTFVGFGLGHALQGRYGDYGWVFTTTQLTGIAISMASLSIVVILAASTAKRNLDEPRTKRQRKADKEIEVAKVITAIGAVTFGISRLFEMVHVWMPSTPPDRKYVKRKAVHYLASRTEPTLSVAPLLSTKQFGLQVELRF